MTETCELLCLDLEVAEALRRAAPSRQELERASLRASALGDPTRLELVAALRGTDELCVCDLGWITGRSQALVSHHLRALRTAGLAVSRREGKMVMYRLSEPGRMLAELVLSGDQAVV